MRSACGAWFSIRGDFVVGFAKRKFFIKEDRDRHGLGDEKPFGQNY